MPTKGRSRYAYHAFESFIAQTYPCRELVILDDFTDRSFPNGVTHPLVRYYVSNEQFNLPQKRNAINAMTAGDLIAHWDSDDWSAPERLAHQVEALEASGKAMTGFNKILFYDDRNGQTTVYDEGMTWWVSGTSMLYTRSWAVRNKFYERQNTGSDVKYAREAHRHGQLHITDEYRLIVARIHDGNTSHKEPQKYKQRQEEIPAEFFGCAAAI